MAFDAATLDHLGRLAKLTLDNDERARLGADLARVLSLFDALAAAPTAGVEPLAHPLGLHLRLREDRVTETDRSERLLALAAEAQGGYYLVPKVIE
jgi:aspartyl-tRNA(Asn)/glutamyl-tRNA(Gln) amidotransferase subunit C